MKQPSRKTMFLTSQLSILFISFVTAFLPQYYFMIFIIYAVILTGITFYFSFKGSRGMMKIPPQRELGSPLFKENDATKIAMLDKTLVEEFKKQATASFSMLLLMLLLIIIFPFYRATILPVSMDAFSKIFKDQTIVLFLSFLIMYEFIYGFLTFLRTFFIGRKTQFSTNLMFPQNYIVYRRGIVMNNRFFIELSDRYCMEYDRDRRYVELRDTTSKLRIRLYTDSISELYDKLRSLGINKCGGDNG